MKKRLLEDTTEAYKEQIIAVEEALSEAKESEGKQKEKVKIFEKDVKKLTTLRQPIRD